MAVLDASELGRAATLSRHCEGNSELRRAVGALLQAHESAVNVLPDPTGVLDWRALDMDEGARASREEAALVLGRRFSKLIGDYELVRLLGEGGMGIVFLMEQGLPRRQVALKIVRPDCVSPRMLTRFEHEARTLGRLQHQGIAQIHEAGTADVDGRPQPYFVMEYVSGQPLIEYAESRQLGTRERLELLAKVCNAIQYAHGRGIIHRDLKPGNILVTAEGQPKVLDFGIARVTDKDLKAGTVLTDLGQLIGTVSYMSPEQAGGAPGDHVNADKLSGTNPFPTLFVATQGTVEARIGDLQCEIHGGEAIFIGPGVRHESWIDEYATEGAEGILMMFGEGA